MIGGFEAHGLTVERFIVGDRVPQSWRAAGSQAKVSASFARRVAADLARLALGKLNSRRALQELSGRPAFVYERLAAFAALGRNFKRKGIPWILESNALLYYEATQDRKSMALAGLGRRVELAAYRDCDILVVVSGALRDMILAEVPEVKDKILVVPNGVDVERWEVDRSSANRPFGSRLTIGFSGLLSYGQGLVPAIESLARVRQAGHDVCLLVVGAGPMLPECLAAVERLGLKDSVSFVGQVPWDDVPKYLAGCDLGLSSQVRLSIGKMFRSPLKLYEYMAAGLPVIASAFEDARAVLEDGETGFLYDPDQPSALDAAIVRAVHSRATLDVMGKRAREVVRRDHSWVARSRLVLDRVALVSSKRR